ncbi:MAG TPA: hypothetical protein VNO51_03395 [Ilumatobacteraceae bacterium]|nr:hypothetical protein [Ilumatobacteraceae bacterium]
MPAPDVRVPKSRSLPAVLTTLWTSVAHVNRTQIALASGGDHCDVNYTSFWRLVLGG